MARVALIDGTELLAAFMAGPFAARAGLQIIRFSTVADFLRVPGGPAAFDLVLIDPFSRGLAGLSDLSATVAGARGVPVVLFTEDLPRELMPAVAATGLAGAIGKRTTDPAEVAGALSRFLVRRVAERCLDTAEPLTAPAAGPEATARAARARAAYRAAQRSCEAGPSRPGASGAAMAPLVVDTARGRARFRVALSLEVRWSREEAGPDAAKGLDRMV